MKKLSKYIYFDLLPIYLPSSRRFSDKLHLAIWCCIDYRKSGNLWEILKGVRITIRKNNRPIFVVKKGEI
jgi:hypothetical protein